MKGNLFDNIIEKLQRYKESIEDVGFASPEREKLKKMPENEEELLDTISMILEANHELNRVCDGSNTSMFVADKDGVTLRINKAFEPMVKAKREEFLGKNVWDLDAQGIFRPSVCALALKERRTVAVLQEIKDVAGMAVTGVPIFDKDGNVFRAVTNALLLDYIESMTSYIKGNQKEDIINDHKIIVESKEMQAVVDLADRVKNTESSILITGETGVGKGVLARYIHESGNRKGKPMVHINCGAIPLALLESELFGYESGAFTGAGPKGKPGLIELSHGGTLFLDEISELPFLLQVKMLHFIQSKKMNRVGGTKEISIDTRIIAASNKPLEEEVKKGQFRSDLYYRLNVIPIHIPPLRERKEDILPTATYFLKYFMNKYNKHMVVSEDTLKGIENNPWIGNIRELENYIERIVVTNYSLKLPMSHENISINLENKSSGAREDKELNNAIENLERDMVIKTWNTYRSSYKVAEALGVSQSTAYRKIRKYIKSQI